MGEAFGMKRWLTICGLLVAAGAFGDAITNQPPRIYTKIPWAVGFEMKGTVTNVVVSGEKIQFQFTGWFYMHQYPWGGTNEEVIKVDCQHGISAIVSPTDFVATVPGVNAAVVRRKKDLLPLMEGAAKHGRELKIRLAAPKLDFESQPFLQDAKVLNITDWDLR
jgi:hypothetical protein